MTHEEARDAISLYVVDADDAQTRAEMLAHVASCSECGQTLQEYQQTVDAIGHSVPQIRPRAELRAKTLGAIFGPRPAAVPEMGTATLDAQPAWPKWMAAAAAIVAVASLAGLAQTRGELARVREALQDSLARLADAERSTSAARSELVTYRQAFDVMTSDDQVQVALLGQAPVERAGGKAFMSRSRNTLIFSARDLPQLAPDRVYQLWAIAGDTPVSAGLFMPDASGHGQLVAPFPTLPAQLVALAVTVEPQGGVPSPTGPKYLVGTPAR